MATNIVLYQGHATPKNVILRDATLSQSTFAADDAGISAVAISDASISGSRQKHPIAGQAWHRPLGEPVARNGLRSYLVAAAGLFLVPMPLSTTATPGQFGWYQPLSTVAAKPTPHAAPQGHHLFVPVEATVDNTTVRVWPLTQGEKARPVNRPASQGHHLFVPAEATLDNTTNRVWPLIQDPVAVHTRPVWHTQPIVGYAPAVADNTVTPDNWLIRWDAPPRFWPPKLAAQPFVPAKATIDNTTNVVWPLVQGEKARPLLRPAQLGGQPFVPSQATVDNTTNTVWPLAQGEKARPLARVAPQGTWVFGYPYISQDNTVTVDKWLQPLTRAVNIPRAAQPAGSPFVAKAAVLDNTVTPDKWLQRWQGPPRIRPAKTQVIYPVQAPTVVSNTVTPDKWLMQWKGPPRIRPRVGWVTFLQRPPVTFAQNISAEIELTVDLHVCGWGTEAEVVSTFTDQECIPAFDADAFQNDAFQVCVSFVLQDELTATECDPAFDADAFQNDAFQVCTTVLVGESVYVIQGEQGDVWSEQAAREDEYEEQDECGR